MKGASQLSIKIDCTTPSIYIDDACMSMVVDLRPSTCIDTSLSCDDVDSIMVESKSDELNDLDIIEILNKMDPDDRYGFKKQLFGDPKLQITSVFLQGIFYEIISQSTPIIDVERAVSDAILKIDSSLTKYTYVVTEVMKFIIYMYLTPRHQLYVTRDNRFYILNMQRS